MFLLLLQLSDKPSLRIDPFVQQPLVLHNGPFDLLFSYHWLEESLPAKYADSEAQTQTPLRSHHHHLEFPKKDWAQVQKKHHCKVYHPSGLRPAYCECTCYDGEISEVNKNAQYSGGLVVAANAAN